MSLLNGAAGISATITGSGIYVGADVATVDFTQDFIASNSIVVTIDGVACATVNFTTDNATTLALLQTAINAHASATEAKILQVSFPRISFKAAYQSKEMVVSIAITGGASQANTNINHSGIREIYVQVGGDPTDLLKAVIVDDTSTANYIYVGRAVAGSSSSLPVWSISRINVTSATAPIIQWADGVTDNTKLWSARTTITYS